MAQVRESHREKVVNDLIDQLKQGTAPWLKPWEPGESRMPMNPISGRRYRGCNALYLSWSGYSDPRWLTYKQAQSLGAQVRKGEKSRSVEYWKFTEQQDRLDPTTGKPVIDPATGKPEKITVQLERPRVFYASVFNAEQIDGMPERTPVESHDWERHERAEKLLKASGVPLFHDQADRAFYRPSTDEIHLPERGQFPTPDNYYATALHELGHATGHPSRLDRGLSYPFGTQGYAKEELRAEITSLLLGDELGIGHDPGQHAAYVSNWISILLDDPNELFRAARDAEQAMDFVLGLEHQQQSVAQDQEGHSMAASTDASALAAAAVPEKTWLDVSYEDKDEAKALAGKLPDGRGAIGWDRKEQRWFARPGADLTALQKWLPEAEPAQAVDAAQAAPTPDDARRATEKTWLAIPYAEKDHVRALAGKLDDGRSAISWDKTEKAWFARPGADLARLRDWLPENVEQRQAPELDPVSELAQVLERAGFLLKNLPELDGKKHRCTVEGDKSGAKSGVYCAYLDGKPAGWYQNHRVHEGVQKWTSSGQDISPEEKARLQAEAAEKRAQRAAREQAQYEHTARRVGQLLALLPPAGDDHPYLVAKGVSACAGLKQDRKGNLVMPLQDERGKVWSLQRIGPDGTKRLKKFGRKSGCFFVASDQPGQLDRQLIPLAEGLSTGLSIKEAIGQPVAVAVDAGNLPTVAQALQRVSPEAAQLMCGDDDRHTMQNGVPVNKGRNMALKAAESVGGRTILPQFKSEQTDRKFNDFNDLHRHNGLDAVKRQITAAATQLLAQQRSDRQRQVEQKKSDGKEKAGIER